MRVTFRYLSVVHNFVSTKFVCCKIILNEVTFTFFCIIIQIFIKFEFYHKRTTYSGI